MSEQNWKKMNENDSALTLTLTTNKFLKILRHLGVLN